MAQAVSRLPVTSEARVRGWSFHEGFVVDKVALVQVSLRILQISPVSIIPPSLSNSYHLGDEQYAR
jgi:hypothetical protein